MKICPTFDLSCPYAQLNGDNCYCELPHPERDCDDYAAFAADLEEATEEWEGF